MFELTVANAGWWVIDFSNWLLVSILFIVIPTYPLISKFLYLVCLLFKENYSNYIMYRSPKVENKSCRHGRVYFFSYVHLAIHVSEVTVTAWLVDGTHF